MTERRTGGLFEHLRKICQRPGMYAPSLTLDHLALYIFGYESALGDAGLASQHGPFKEWLYRQRPEWKESSMWWGGHVLDECGGDRDQALDEILKLLDRFLTSEEVGPGPIGPDGTTGR